MFALKSYHYVKIIITNNSSAFLQKFSTFIQYFLFSLSTVWNLIIFNNGKVTDVSAWSCNDFNIIKYVCTRNVPSCKVIWEIPNNFNKESDSAFTENVQCFYPRLRHKLLVALETHQLHMLAFCSQLRDELTWYRLPYTRPDLVVLIITTKLLSKLLF